MLGIDGLNSGDLYDVRTACAYLFSPELAGSDQFLKSLNLETVRTAFRQKAKRYHPDLHRHQQPKMIDRRKTRFVKIRESYETLVGRFEPREQLVFPKKPEQRKIIAVGGAKGGIGKTMFVANLGVLLSSMGWKTVVADLDLGGANLHLYLGETFLKCNINDFLDKKTPSIEGIMTKTKYGPLLIGGESSQLGAANISFARKLKLLKAIKQIDADCVIIDLGGDTSYNIIDFFLAADHGFVMTTCDPASYLDAYNFIKVALYRKLDRFFGPESTFRDRKDNELQELIREAILSSNGSRVKTIAELLDRVREQQFHNLSLIREVISSFRPQLIVNRVRDNSNATQVLERIKNVAKNMLSIKVGFRGTLPYQLKIESSARDLVPIVSRYPKGELAKQIGHIIKTF
jgi:flagellar biosynthesis protein FlhG